MGIIEQSNTIWESLSKYAVTALGSTIKFIGGPLAGLGSQLNYWETYLCTVVGMMITVTLLSYIGTPARQWIADKLQSKRKKQKKVFTKRNRRIVKVWKQYGMKGVAFLTPLLLTPPGGTLIAISFGEQRKKIVLYMFISAVVWGAILTAVVYLLGDQVIKGYIGA